MSLRSLCGTKVKRQGSFWLIAVVPALGLCPNARAQTSISVPNFSFESPATTTVAYAANWTSTGTDYDVYNPYDFDGNNVWYTGANSTTDPAHGGAGFAGISGENLAYFYNAAAGSALSQTLAATFSANTSYTLTVSVGNRNGVENGGTTSFAGSEIELLAGTTVIASDIFTSGPTSGTFTTQTASITATNAFSNLAGQALTIKLATTNATNTANTATDWDNVRLTSATAPEPGTRALAALGFLPAAGFLKAIRSRRRTAHARIAFRPPDL